MRSLRNLAIYSVGAFVLLELMLVGAILYWPDFNVAAVRTVASPIPALLDLVDEIEATGVFGYIAGQHFFKGCNALGTAAAILFAVGAVAGEAHRGTLEMWLARPFSRNRILMERYFAGTIAYALPIFATTLTIPWLAEQIDEVVDLRPFLLGAVHQVIFLHVIYSGAFLCSTFGTNPIRIALGFLFVTTFFFAIYFVKVVTHYSFYRLADIGDYVRIDDAGALDLGTVVPLALTSAAFLCASLWSFRRRVP